MVYVIIRWMSLFVSRWDFGERPSWLRVQRLHGWRKWWWRNPIFPWVVFLSFPAIKSNRFVQFVVKGQTFHCIYICDGAKSIIYFCTKLNFHSSGYGIRFGHLMYLMYHTLDIYSFYYCFLCTPNLCYIPPVIPIDQFMWLYVYIYTTTTTTTTNFVHKTIYSPTAAFLKKMMVLAPLLP